MLGLKLNHVSKRGQWCYPLLCLESVFINLFDQHFDGLVQDCSNSSALAMELLQSCTKPSILLTLKTFINEKNHWWRYELFAKCCSKRCYWSGWPYNTCFWIPFCWNVFQRNSFTPVRLFGLDSENLSHVSPSSFEWDVKWSALW